VRVFHEQYCVHPLPRWSFPRTSELCLSVEDAGKVMKLACHGILILALRCLVKVNNSGVADIIYEKVWRSDIAMEITSLVDSFQCRQEGRTVVESGSLRKSIMDYPHRF
jgi:hypothetical protein